MMINIGTTIITFLMVFLIQKTQNKDSKAIQIKLNELISAHENANNRLVDIEDLTEKKLDKLHAYYEKFSKLKENILWALNNHDCLNMTIKWIFGN